jgi:hypothetical protein
MKWPFESFDRDGRRHQPEGRHVLDDVKRRDRRTFPNGIVSMSALANVASDRQGRPSVANCHRRRIAATRISAEM